MNVENPGQLRDLAEVVQPLRNRGPSSKARRRFSIVARLGQSCNVHCLSWPSSGAYHATVVTPTLVVVHQYHCTRSRVANERSADFVACDEQMVHMFASVRFNMQACDPMCSFVTEVHPRDATWVQPVADGRLRFTLQIRGPPVLASYYSVRVTVVCCLPILCMDNPVSIWHISPILAIKTPPKSHR